MIVLDISAGALPFRPSHFIDKNSKTTILFESSV